MINPIVAALLLIMCAVLFMLCRAIHALNLRLADAERRNIEISDSVTDALSIAIVNEVRR